MSDVIIDSVDREIIAALKEDGRMSYAALAQRAGVAEGTARNRLIRLLETHTITIGPIVDQTKIGYRLNLWIGMRCRVGTLRTVADALAKLHAIRYVGATTGAYDVVCEAIFLSEVEMLAFFEHELPQVDGITDVQTALVLEIAKLGYEWELREEDPAQVRD